MKNGKTMNYGSAGFEQIMMSDNEKKADQHDVLTPEDFVIEKVAGIDIYNPTIDNIERFVREYTQNQLYYLHRKLEISTNLIPNHLNSGNPELVEDATGVVSFRFEGVLIELPFIVYGGQLVPFDVIQIGNQRVPYSQEHMKKIVKGILENKNAPKNKALDPYVGVDKTVNPSSTVGFLGNIMSIQDQHRNRGDAMHVYAEADVAGIEKEAGLFGKPKYSVTNALEDYYGGKLDKNQKQEVKNYFKSEYDADPDEPAFKEQMNSFKNDKFEFGKYASNMEKEAGKAKSIAQATAGAAGVGAIEGAIPGAIIGTIAGAATEPKDGESQAKHTRKFLLRGAGIGAGLGATGMGSLILADGIKHTADVVDVTSLLSKLAEMKPYDLPKLKSIIEKVAEEQFIAEFEKFAADDTEVQKNMEKVMAKIAATNWQNANTLKNGTYIQMPEMKEMPNGTPEITMTPALVIDNFFSFGYENPKGKIILTADQRMKILKNGDTLLCLAMDHPTFKVPSIKFESVKQGDYVMAFNGNQAMFPCKVTYVRQRKHDGNVLCDMEANPGFGRSGVRDETLLGSIVQLEPIGLNNDKSFFNSSNDEPDINWDDPAHLQVDINLVSLKGGKFNKLDYGQFIDAKAKETGLAHEIVSSFFGENSVISRVRKRRGDQQNDLGVWTVDPETSIVLIKGTISDYLENAKNIEHFASPDLKAIEKLASGSEYVEVRIRNKQQNTFDMKLVYTDRSKRFYNQQVKRFDNVEEYKIRGVMRACGFEQAQAAEAVAKAKKDGFAKFDLPANATPDNVSGSAPKGIAEDTFSRIKTVLFTPEIKNQMAIEVAGAILGDVGSGLVNLSKGAAEETAAFQKMASTTLRDKAEIRHEAVAALRKKAGIAAACSSMFEKLAMEKKTNAFRDIALNAALACDFMMKVAEMIATDDFYPVERVAQEIVIGQPNFEKLAFDLTKFKVEEYQNGNFIVDPNHIQQTVLSLAAMVDTAHAVTKVAGERFARLEKEANLAGVLSGAAAGAGLGGIFGAARGHARGDEGSAFTKDIGAGMAGGALGGAVGGGIASAGVARKAVGNPEVDEMVNNAFHNTYAPIREKVQADARVNAAAAKGDQVIADMKQLNADAAKDIAARKAKLAPEGVDTALAGMTPEQQKVFWEASLKAQGGPLKTKADVDRYFTE